MTPAVSTHPQVEYEDYRRQALVAEAAKLGVELAELDPYDYPGLYFAFRPEHADWPDIHLVKYPRDWRLYEVDIPGMTYARHWRYAADRHSFADVVGFLEEWAGDPGSEPRRFTYSWDGREDD